MIKKMLLSLAVFLPLSVSAASLHLGDYFLKGAEQIPGDLYTVGRTTTLAGTVAGDATAVGRDIFSNGIISMDALFFGEGVRIEGEVADDVRVAGGIIVIDGTVRGDVIAIGAQVTVGSKARIEGSLYVVGGEVVIRGIILGDTKVFSNDLLLSGMVEGDLELWGTASFENPARIGGDYIYHTNRAASPPVKVTITGKVIADEGNGLGNTSSRNAIGGLFSLRVLMMLVLGFALFFLTRGRTEEVILETLPNFLARTLRGLLILVILPILAVLFIPTIIGIPIALSLGAFFLLLILLSWAGSGILFGVWCEQFFFKRSAFPLTYRSVLIGTLSLSLLSMIPFLGVLFHGILILATAGSLGTLFFRELRFRR